MLTEALHCMNDLVDESLVSFLVEAGLVVRLACIARQINQYKPLMVPITQIITRINCTQHSNTVHCVDSGFVQIFFAWLQIENLKKSVIKELLYCISNFTIDSSEVCAFVLDDSQRFSTLVRLCYHADPRVRSEAVWNFSNSTAVCTPDKIRVII